VLLKKPADPKAAYTVLGSDELAAIAVTIVPASGPLLVQLSAASAPTTLLIARPPPADADSVLNQAGDVTQSASNTTVLKRRDRETTSMVDPRIILRFVGLDHARS
jgi:hypothetical protein